MGGQDKALMGFAGTSLIAHVIDRLEPQVESLLISANGDLHRFARFQVPVVADEMPMGPLSGILAALRWSATRGATAVISAPVDCPFLPPDLVPRLCLAAEPTGLALAASGGNLHPTFGHWPVTLADDLARFLRSGVKARVRDFATAHGAGTAEFPDDGAFINLNTVEDLRLAENRLQGRT